MALFLSLTEGKVAVRMTVELETQKINLLVEIVEHLLATSSGGSIDPIARVACIDAYVRLCSLTFHESIDRYITSTSTGMLLKIHLPTNPEGFLAQLIHPLLVQCGPTGLCALISTLNGCLHDQAIIGRVKLNILNVENSLVRQAVITDLPADSLELGRSFCAIRRELVIDAIDRPSEYFMAQHEPENVSIFFSLYRLYVDTERNLYLRLAPQNLMLFFDDLLNSSRRRKEMLSMIFQSAIEANHQAILLTVEAMREKLDLYSEWLGPDKMEQLERSIEYGSELVNMDIRGVTIQLANATFRGIDVKELYTLIQFVVPFELKEGAVEAQRAGILDGELRFEVLFRKTHSSYQDPTVIYLANIGSERLGGLPSLFLSDVNPTQNASSTLIFVKLGGFVALDFDVVEDGVIVEKDLAEEKALRGEQYYPHKELVVNLLRAIYRGVPGEFPIQCKLEDLNVDAFSNFIVDYRLSVDHRLAGFGDTIIHRKAYLLTSRDAFLRACRRYGDQIGEMYRHDKDVSIKALVKNSSIRTNESLRNFVYKALELTVKRYVECQSCWKFLWEGDPKRPKSETDVHPFIDSCLKALLEMKGIRVSREVRTANGAVDFFCSFTTKRSDMLKVCIEVKNAHGTGLESGISKQLPAYMDSERPCHGIYLVLWYKGDEDWPQPEKFDLITEIMASLETMKPKDGYCIDVMTVNCTKPKPPSKR